MLLIVSNVTMWRGKGGVVSCKKRNLELFKLQHKTGAATIYSIMEMEQQKMNRNVPTIELLMNEVLEVPLIFELGGSINCQ